ncbi:MAG: M48 family metallopeptidase, partial [Burkholderiales bacterium]|nr:M48 family metallopeptidase [Burkholderiales bacterium]
GASLLVTGDGVHKTVAHPDWTLEEMFESTFAYLRFADGSHCEIVSAEARRQARQLFAYRESWVERWQKQWQIALLAIVLMGVFLFSAYRWGLPILANKVAMMVTPEMEQKLGDQALISLDQSLFLPSRLSEQRIAQAQNILKNLLPNDARLPIRLEVRDAPKIGPNAFALPGNTIVLTDQMLELILDHGQKELRGDQAYELAGVLAHEIGHIQYRHDLKELANSAFLVMLTGTLFGDFSTVATMAPTALVQSEYSRAKEAEADAYAVTLLRQHAISASHLADLFEKLEQMEVKKAGSKMPKWFRVANSYVSSHPSTPDRIAYLRAAAK